MKDISVSKVNTVAVGAVTTGLSMYLILAGVGYSTFGNLVDPDILTNYPGTSLTLNIT